MWIFNIVIISAQFIYVILFENDTLTWHRFLLNRHFNPVSAVISQPLWSWLYFTPRSPFSAIILAASLVQHSNSWVEACRCSSKGCAGKRDLLLCCLTMGNKEVPSALTGEGMLEQTRLGATLLNHWKFYKPLCAWQWWPSPAGLLHGHLCRLPADGNIGLQDIFTVHVTGMFPLPFSEGVNLLLQPGWGAQLDCYLCSLWAVPCCCQGLDGARSFEWLLLLPGA